MSLEDSAGPLATAAAYGAAYRSAARPLHPKASASDLRGVFCGPLPERPSDGVQVIEELIAAAEPGLVGNTEPNFFAWVMGASDPVGVAADWLTSVWGQNAAIYQTAPAAAIAEEAVSDWILELLDLPRESSVGFVTGATMAGFVALAAARTDILARLGHDLAEDGLQSAPKIHIFLSDDAHVSNLTALRLLGFGASNIVSIPSDALGLMDVGALEQKMSVLAGPKIIIAQAGHIMSGGFDDFQSISALAQDHGAWLHVDGAFGMWARVLPEKSLVTRGVELADSWSVDGHKWLHIPYDLGFAIVRDPKAHRAAMDATAGYLNAGNDDGRNPTEFNPELSRRARGFVAWAVIRHLGRAGIEKLVRSNCTMKDRLARRLKKIDGLVLCPAADLNQMAFYFADPRINLSHLLDLLNQEHGVFIKDAMWKGRRVARVSMIAKQNEPETADILTRAIAAAVAQLQAG